MLLSLDRKFIFISNPKTGSSAINLFLRKVDPGLIQNGMPEGIYEQKIITGKDEHIRPRHLKVKMGSYFDEFQIFTFVRSPYERTVSVYFFYKNGKPINHRNNKRLFFSLANICLARLLPFSIYSLIKPIRPNRDYVLDNESNFIVNFIGRTNYFDRDLCLIMKEFGIVLGAVPLTKINASSHDSEYDKYYSSPVHRYLFNLKFKDEIKFFNFLKDKPANFDWKGIHFS